MGTFGWKPFIRNEMYFVGISTGEENIEKCGKVHKHYISFKFKLSGHLPAGFQIQSEIKYWNFLNFPFFLNQHKANLCDLS